MQLNEQGTQDLDSKTVQQIILMEVRICFPDVLVKRGRFCCCFRVLFCCFCSFKSIIPSDPCSFLAGTLPEFLPLPWQRKG